MGSHESTRPLLAAHFLATNATATVISSASKLLSSSRPSIFAFLQELHHLGGHLRSGLGDFLAPGTNRAVVV